MQKDLSRPGPRSRTVQVALAMVIGLVTAQVNAFAATITVTTASGVAASESATDGKCDLIEAVRAANTNAAYHECTAGSSSGMDKIVLTSGRSYPLKKTLLPTSSVEITTSSTGTVTISPTSWISSTLPGRECLIYAKNASYSVETRLTGVTLDGLNTIGVAGFCNAKSNAGLRRVRITRFQRGGVRSWCDDEHGCPSGASSGLSINLSRIDSNTSSENGAGVVVAGLNANLAVTNSAIVSNVSEGFGGGIWVGSGPGIPTISNSTIAGNSAFRGGGIALDGYGSENVYVQVFDSTIAYNNASDEGGGLFLQPPGTGSSRDFIISNSIINNNSSYWGVYPNVNNASGTSGLFNCAANSIIYLSPGTAPINVYVGESCLTTVEDAGLGPLGPMGGNGLPVVPLLKGSVAIDGKVTDPSTNPVQQLDAWLAGEVGGVGGPAAWQLLERDVDGDENGSAIRDVGAFEFNPNWEGEITAVQSTSGGSKAVETNANYSQGAGMKFAPTSCSSTTSSITYAVPVAEFGRFWSISLGHKSTTTSGAYRVEVANSTSGPWTVLKSNLNTYTPVTVYSSVQLNGNFFFQATGTKYFRFTLTGVGTPNGGCNLFVDYLYLMPK